MTNRTIRVEQLARVEGEGALDLRIRDGKIEDVKLRIFEPARLFEAFLRGRDFREAPDITARICGICPVAYIMSASHAMEDACGITVDGQLRELRRLIYCGEWIESHTLHIAMLHAPDFLGCPDVMAMAREHPETVKLALRVKKIGNEVVRVLGGREVHPINCRVGGFYRTPSKPELGALRPLLEEGLDGALRLVQFVAGFDFPMFEKDYEFVALRHPTEYPFNEGRLTSTGGIDVAVQDYDRVLDEEQVEHSTALHSRLKGRGAAHMGPMARYALNYARLTPGAKRAAADAGLGTICRNPFKSIIVRAVELVFAFEEALRIVDAYQPPPAPFVEVPARSGCGYAATEAPRGLCYHRYRIDEAGLIEEAKIVAPTSVNQHIIEQDLRDFIQPHIELPDAALQLECERAIRNYDPCISCSTHFLKLHVDRDGLG
jgi:coenzyme F420-reducing hydrogenase alpha subunit